MEQQELKDVVLIHECEVGVAWPRGWVTLDLSYATSREDVARGQFQRLPLIGAPPQHLRQIAQQILQACDDAERDAASRRRPQH